MTTPLEDLPAKPIRFLMEERLSPNSRWVSAGDRIAACASDAVRKTCNRLNEKSDNVRVVGIAYFVPVEDSQR